MDWNKKQPKIKYNENQDVLTKLVKINGIESPNEFFKPSKKHLHGPELLGNIDNATDKIISAIKNNDLIGISFDVDYDGISAGSIMYRYLKNFTDNIYYMYPDGREHGIEYQTDKIKPNKKLVIIVDSSTNSIDTCKELAEQGLELIILDHHQLDQGENKYATIVNPQLCDYPNKEISGAGVVWKTIQVLDSKLNSNYNNNFIDLVGSALVADVMDMSVLENRYLVYQALDNIKNKGLKAILQIMKPNHIDSSTVGYVIAPMINGSIRLNQTEQAIKLLLSDNPMECSNIVNSLKAMNDKRKNVEESIYQEVLQDIEGQIDAEDKIIIVPYNKSLSSNYNGLIASKIANNFQRPAIFMVEENGYLKGSYRGYNNFNVRDFLHNINGVDWAKGHDSAGGTGFFASKLNTIKKQINKNLSEEEFKPQIKYDLEIDAGDIDEKLIQRLDKYNHVTGRGFESAKFRVKGLMTTKKEVIGQNKDTIKITCSTNNGGELVLIKFKTDKNWKNDIGTYDEIEAVGQLNLNEFFNWGKKEMITTKQVLVDDVKIVN